MSPYLGPDTARCCEESLLARAYASGDNQYVNYKLQQPSTLGEHLFKNKRASIPGRLLRVTILPSSPMPNR